MNDGYSSSFGSTPYQDYGASPTYTGVASDSSYSGSYFSGTYGDSYNTSIYDDELVDPGRPVYNEGYAGGTEASPLYIESKRPFPILAVILGLIVVFTLLGIVLILIVKNKKKSLKNEYKAVKGTKFLTGKDNKSDDIKAGKDDKTEKVKAGKEEKNPDGKSGEKVDDKGTVNKGGQTKNLALAKPS